MAINGASRYRFGAFEIDLHTGEFWKHGTRVRLGGQPFQILAVLVKRPGELVSREELRSQLWPGDTYVDFDHGLNAAVNKLRDVLCDSAEIPKYIETLPRRGYRMVSTVESLSERGEAQPVATSAEGSPPTGETSKTLERVRQPSQSVQVRRLTYGAIAITVIAILAAGVWELAKRKATQPNGPHSSIAESAVPIRIFPLTNLSDHTSEPAFSPDGTRVAFRRESRVAGQSGIWVKEVGGEQLVQLTRDGRDYCPVWRPDGRAVAFSRLNGKRRSILAVSASAGAAKELLVTDIVPEHAELDWAPDGKSIAYVAAGDLGSPAIFLLSLENAVENRRLRQLTSPLALQHDWGPAFSPDGTRIAFVRMREILVVQVQGGEAQLVSQEKLRVMGSPTWTADGQSIVFASIDGEKASLRRIPAAGGAATRIADMGTFAWSPAISRRGFKLAAEVLSQARTIEEMTLESSEVSHSVVTTLSGENGAPDLSPDEKALVFRSDRGGGEDLWVSDRKGQNPVQLTAIGTADAPRWSPGGKQVVFEAASGEDSGATEIFVVDVHGGTPRLLAPDRSSNQAPTWSRDGQSIYFASNRSGDWQVWRIQQWSGTPVQVTTGGGFTAQETSDGKYLYYAKGIHNPEIWRMSVSGRTESAVAPAIRPLTWGTWAVISTGIVFVAPGADGEPLVSLYDFSTQSVRHLKVLDKPPSWITVRRDGKAIVFDQPSQEESHIVVLENFR